MYVHVCCNQFAGHLSWYVFDVRPCRIKHAYIVIQVLITIRRITQITISFAIYGAIHFPHICNIICVYIYIYVQREYIYVYIYIHMVYVYIYICVIYMYVYNIDVYIHPPHPPSSSDAPKPYLHAIPIPGHNGTGWPP